MKIILAAWAFSIAAGYFLVGGYLGKALEGYDLSRVSSLPLYVTLAALLAAVVVTIFVIARKGSTSESADGSGDPVQVPSTRRKFLTGSLGITAGVAATGAAVLAKNAGWYSTTAKNIFLVRPPYKADQQKADWQGSRVVSYRRLGRTDVRVSDISIGSGSSTGGRQTVDVVKEAMDRGINYFDTAPDYAETGSENRFGEAMQGRRDQVFLATKFCTPRGHLGPGTSVDEYMEAVNGSLRRLKTDWVDLVHIHSCDTVDRLMDENVHEAFDRLKEQGKVRFLGVSTHTPDLVTVANKAIDSDRFDVMMLAYHFGAWPELAGVIDRAAEKDIGVVAMKTLRGAKHKQLDMTRDEKDSYTQAAFKWVLSNPAVSCLVISLWESEQLDEFLYASGQSMGADDIAVLQKYDSLVRGSHCRQHCGACLDKCPAGLPVDDILRYKMYFEDFGAQKDAMQHYAGLNINSNPCLNCSAPCESACPEGISIAARVSEARDLLRIA